MFKFKKCNKKSYQYKSEYHKVQLLDLYCLLFTQMISHKKYLTVKH